MFSSSTYPKDPVVVTDTNKKHTVGRTSCDQSGLHI